MMERRYFDISRKYDSDHECSNGFTKQLPYPTTYLLKKMFKNKLLGYLRSGKT